MKTISHAKYDEFVECYVFMNSIREVLQVETPKEALGRVKELVQEVSGEQQVA